jgi:hypothetical protein
MKRLIYRYTHNLRVFFIVYIFILPHSTSYDENSVEKHQYIIPEANEVYWNWYIGVTCSICRYEKFR